MKVDNPRFDALGEVRCGDCPWDELGCPTGNCPTPDNYGEQCTDACRLAGQANKGDGK